MDQEKPHLKAIIKLLPKEPGVYIMRDDNGQVIYVGKAKSLRDRVSSYFLKSKSYDQKTVALVSQVDFIDHILTETETEALVLENNLIKKYSPRYNILLKDDKHYPYIKVTTDEEFPYVEVVREIRNDRARYFGPFPNSGIVKPSIKFLSKFFPLRSCKGDLKNKSLCLNFHIGRCLGPCENDCQEEYQLLCRQLVLFLEGKYDRLKRHFEALMKELSASLQYEEAARYRDRLLALQRITQKQKVILEGLDDIDVVAYIIKNRKLFFCIMAYREGFLVKQFDYSVEKSGDPYFDLYQGLVQHYEGREDLPEELVLDPSLIEYSSLFGELELVFSRKILIKYPRRGKKNQLLSLAIKNINKQMYDRNILTSQTKQELEELGEALGLEGMPTTIVGFDISNLAGTNIVASAVYFENGRPKKSLYRKFSIKSVKNKQDDYRSMYEVVYRYFKKQREADVILIDGGKGQLNSALDALNKLKVVYKKVIGIAKREEELFTIDRNDPIILSKRSSSLKLLQRVRDEAHRFAITYQKKKRKKTTFGSSLEEIADISQVRMNKLLLYFGSLEAIKKASLDDIMNVPGFGEKLSRKIFEKFH